MWDAPVLIACDLDCGIAQAQCKTPPRLVAAWGVAEGFSELVRDPSRERRDRSSRTASGMVA